MEQSNRFEIYCIYSFSIIVALSWLTVAVASDLGRSFRHLNRNDVSGPRIIGGSPQSDYNYAKHMVSIRSAEKRRVFGDNHFCTGVILTMRLIVTVAHCVVGPNKLPTKPRRLRVVAGAPNRFNRTKNTIISHVDAVLPHEDYSRTGGNDVAVLRLKIQLEKNRDIQEINYDFHNEPDIGIECIIAGWGEIYKGGPYSGDVMYAKLIIMERSQCANVFGSEMNNGTICAGDPEEQQAPCRGDSGAPLICNNFLYGVFSLSNGCGPNKASNIFTAVGYYKDWFHTVNSIRSSRPSSFLHTLTTIVFISTAAILNNEFS